MRRILLVLIVFSSLALIGCEGEKVASAASKPSPSKVFPKPWPPKVDAIYPKMDLLDHQGKKFELEQFKGKVIIIEPVGMNCPACQSLAGANEHGVFGDIQDQGSLSFEKIVKKYQPTVDLADEKVVLVQLLLYDMFMKHPDAEDAARWAEHFKVREHENRYVAVPKSDLRGKASYNLIPGFQLIDKDFYLRADSTGHHPRDHFYETWLPMLPKLIEQAS